MPTVLGNGIPSQSQIYPVSRESLNAKSKQGAQMEIPGVFYNQFAPTAAQCNVGTGAISIVSANYIGQAAAATAAAGAATAVTYVSATGVFTIATAGWMPTTANYNYFPVIISYTTGGAVPTTFNAGQIYYANWVSANTFTLSATIGGTAISGGGTGTTVTVQAANLPGVAYYGSPILPAGFFAASEGIGTSNYGSTSAFPGVKIHGEVTGTVTTAGTPTALFQCGLINGAGTFVNIPGASTATAIAAVGPFPFIYTFDFVCQQFGPATIAGTTYGNLGLIRGWGRGEITQSLVLATVASINMVNNWGSSVAIDLTAQQTIDVRFTFGTAAATTWLEPLSATFWAYN